MASGHITTVGRIRSVDHGNGIKCGDGAGCGNVAVDQWSRGVEWQRAPVRKSVMAGRNGAFRWSKAVGAFKTVRPKPQGCCRAGGPRK